MPTNTGLPFGALEPVTSTTWNVVIHYLGTNQLTNNHMGDEEVQPVVPEAPKEPEVPAEEPAE